MDIKKEIKRAISKGKKGVHFKWRFSEMPSGGLRWQSRFHVRGYLVDVDGKEIVLSDGTRTLTSSGTLYRNINGNTRRCDRDDESESMRYCTDLEKKWGRNIN